MLQLLADRDVNAIGVDASESGIDRCAAAGLPPNALVIFDDIRLSNMLRIWREITRPKARPHFVRTLEWYGRYRLERLTWHQPGRSVLVRLNRAVSAFSSLLCFEIFHALENELLKLTDD